MVVNNMVIEDLSKDAGNERTEKARNYQKANKVKIRRVEYEDNKNFEVSAIVMGKNPYRTFVEIKNGLVEDISCTCDDYYNHYSVCKHTLATILELNDNPQYKEEFGDNNIENDLKNEKQAVLEIRSHIGWYLKGVKGSNEIKNNIYKMTKIYDILQVLEKFKEAIYEEERCL